MQPIVTSFCFEGPRRSVRSRGLGNHVDDDVAEQTGTKNSKMTKSSGIVMQNWESRNFIHNATSDQVRAAFCSSINGSPRISVRTQCG